MLTTCLYFQFWLDMHADFIYIDELNNEWIYAKGIGYRSHWIILYYSIHYKRQLALSCIYDLVLYSFQRISNSFLYVWKIEFILILKLIFVVQLLYFYGKIVFLGNQIDGVCKQDQ